MVKIEEIKLVDYYKVDTVANETMLPTYKPPVGQSIVEVLGHPEFKQMKTGFPKKDANGNTIDLVDVAVFPVKYQETNHAWIMNVTPLKTSKGAVNATTYGQLCAIIAANGGDPQVVLTVHRIGEDKNTRYILVKQ